MGDMYQKAMIRFCFAEYARQRFYLHWPICNLDSCRDQADGESQRVAVAK